MLDGCLLMLRGDWCKAFPAADGLDPVVWPALTIPHPFLICILTLEDKDAVRNLPLFTLVCRLNTTFKYEYVKGARHKAIGSGISTHYQDDITYELIPSVTISCAGALRQNLDASKIKDDFTGLGKTSCTYLFVFISDYLYPSLLGFSGVVKVLLSVLCIVLFRLQRLS